MPPLPAGYDRRRRAKQVSVRCCEQCRGGSPRYTPRRTRAYRLRKAQPRIRIDLFITNLFLDLVTENIDVAIRFGELEDSSVVATRIGNSIRYIVSAPDYLKGRKLPVEPADLELHECVLLNARNNETDWDLVSGRKKRRIHVSGAISSRDFNSCS